MVNLQRLADIPQVGILEDTWTTHEGRNQDRLVT
jgi:hypothetical protein